MRALLTAFLLCANFAFACQQVTITAQLYTNPYAMHSLQWAQPYYKDANGYGFPFAVPAGHYMGITHASFSSKDISKAGNSRNNYFVLVNLMSIPESSANVAFSAPLTLPPGFVLNAAFINNSDEHQNMTALVVGWLSQDPLFKDCR
jgi:hypothetical protein